MRRALVVLALLAGGCAEGITPVDTVVRAFFFSEGETGFSGDVQIQGGTCWRLDDDIEVTLNDRPPSSRFAGGANVLDCSTPSLFFDSVGEPPFALVLARDALEERMEVDADFAVTRCDFAECVVEGFADPGRPVPVPVEGP